MSSDIVGTQPVSDARLQRRIATWRQTLGIYGRRLVDIVVSLLGMLLLSPLFLLIALLIKRDSPGPILFRGKRAGKGGRLFNILKFRTMYERPESYAGPKVTGSGDGRITPLGRWLRDTKLNEIPQLWNVFKGEMTLVGPRPEDPDIVAQWSEEMRQEILSVKPGITSPASVLYRDEETLLPSGRLMAVYMKEILPSKLRLDQLYVRHRTLLTDLDVILWTSVVMLPRLRGLQVPENLLLWGPISRFIERFLTWFLADILVSYLAIGFAGLLWRISAPLDIGFFIAAGIAFAIAVLFGLVNAVLGINRISWSQARAGDALDLVLSTGLVTLVLFVLNLLWKGGPLLPPALVVVAGSFSFFGFLAVRYRLRLVTGLASRWLELRGDGISQIGERVLIVGGGEAGQLAAGLFGNPFISRAFSILGVVMDGHPRKLGMRINGTRVLGTTLDIPALIEKFDVGLIVFALTDLSHAREQHLVSLCQAPGVRLVFIHDLLEILQAYLPSDEDHGEGFFLKVFQTTTVDRLTGALNQHHFLKRAEEEQLRARRYSRPLALIHLSVDYPRPPQATYMRQVGNQLMKGVASRCMNQIRAVDHFGRCGLNHFMLLLPETSLAAAETVAERLQRSIADVPMETDRGLIHPEISLEMLDAEDRSLVLANWINDLAPPYGSVGI